MMKVLCSPEKCQVFGGQGTFSLREARSVSGRLHEIIWEEEDEQAF